MKKFKLLLIASLFVVAFNYCEQTTTADSNTESEAQTESAEQAEGDANHDHEDGEAQASTETASGEVYECAMKCEGSTSDKPGKCSKCNMDLEKKEA